MFIPKRFAVSLIDLFYFSAWLRPSGQKTWKLFHFSVLGFVIQVFLCQATKTKGLKRSSMAQV